MIKDLRNDTQLLQDMRAIALSADTVTHMIRYYKYNSWICMTFATNIGIRMTKKEWLQCMHTIIPMGQPHHQHHPLSRLPSQWWQVLPWDHKSKCAAHGCLHPALKLMIKANLLSTTTIEWQHNYVRKSYLHVNHICIPIVVLCQQDILLMLAKVRRYLEGRTIPTGICQLALKNVIVGVW